jgi:hypothetical protein
VVAQVEDKLVTVLVVLAGVVTHQLMVLLILVQVVVLVKALMAQVVRVLLSFDTSFNRRSI